jgi:hypothetical protein
MAGRGPLVVVKAGGQPSEPALCHFGKLVDFIGAEGGTRTRTGLAPQRILSPLCLPFHHPGIAHGQRIRWLGSHSSNHL